MTLSLLLGLLLGVNALAVLLAGLHVYRTHVRVTEIRDLLVEIREDLSG